MRVAFKTASLESSLPKGVFHEYADDTGTTKCGVEVRGPLWIIDDFHRVTCRKCLKLSKSKEPLGSYTDRFFTQLQAQERKLELIPPRELVALFFEFLKEEGRLTKIK